MRGGVQVLTSVFPNPLKSANKNLSNFTFNSYHICKIEMMTMLRPTPSTEPPWNSHGHTLGGQYRGASAWLRRAVGKGSHKILKLLLDVKLPICELVKSKAKALLKFQEQRHKYSKQNIGA